MSAEEGAAAMADEPAALAHASEDLGPDEGGPAREAGGAVAEKEDEAGTGARGGGAGGEGAERKARKGRVDVPYTIPEWSAAPSVKFHLEVLKNGSIVGDLDISQKGAYMFGRLDLCDFVLEHPSSSRFHAVVQFGEDNAAMLMDLHSAHGTFINKQQVKAGAYVPLRVGDVLRFGQSSRLYVFLGPTELMPEEGLSRAERRALRRQAAQEAGQTAQRQAVLRARGGVGGGPLEGQEGGGEEEEEDAGASWGFQEDAEQEAEEVEDADELTWRTFKGELTDHQKKTREKLQKRLEKVGHMQREMEVIEAKEVSQGGLSQGQQTQIARNQQRVQQLMEEAESLEETLNESIREAVSARTKGGAGSGARREGGGDEDDEYMGDSDDEFYDRSSQGRRKRRRGGGAAQGGAGDRVETAASLLLKQHELTEKEQALRLELAAEEERVRVARAEAEQEGRAAAQEGPKGGSRGGEEEDALDAFMSSVTSQVESDRVGLLQREVRKAGEALRRVQQLLRLADPAGEASAAWAPPKVRAKGSFAAWAASLGAKKAAAAAAPAPAGREPAGVSANAEAEAASERDGGSGAAEHSGEGLRPKGVGEHGEGEGAVGAGDELGATRLAQNGDGDRARGVGVARESAAVPPSGTQDGDMKPPGRRPTALSAAVESSGPSAMGPPPGREKGRGAVQSGAASSKVDVEDAGVQPVKRRVLGPARPPSLPVADEEDADAEGARGVDVWVPPQGQSGDGKTVLNEKLGY